MVLIAGMGFYPPWTVSLVLDNYRFELPWTRCQWIISRPDVSQSPDKGNLRSMVWSCHLDTGRSYASSLGALRGRSGKTDRRDPLRTSPNGPRRQRTFRTLSIRSALQ